MLATPACRIERVDKRGDASLRSVSYLRSRQTTSSPAAGDRSRKRFGTYSFRGVGPEHRRAGDVRSRLHLPLNLALLRGHAFIDHLHEAIGRQGALAPFVVKRLGRLGDDHFLQRLALFDQRLDAVARLAAMTLSLLVVTSVGSAATYLRQEALRSRDGTSSGLR